MTKLVSTRYGEMECLEGDGVVSRALTIYGEWAQSELDTIRAFVKPGNVVLDVGAFLGTHTLAFAKMVGETGSVHSFEPRRDIEILLSRNVKHNSLERVHVHQCALGVKRENLAIAAIDTNADQNFGGLSIEAVGDAQFGVERSTESIAIIPMDEFGFDRVDFIKIDAEGMEAEVIQGGRLTLKKHRPLIFAECNDLEKGSITLQSLFAMDYIVYGAVCRAFNPSNHRGSLENIYDFPDAAEVSLLAIPLEKFAYYANGFDFSRFPRIRTLDALSLLMLHKPQYIYEAMENTEAAKVLGLNFGTSLSRRLTHEIERISIEVARLNVALTDLDEKLELANHRSEDAILRYESSERERTQLLQYRSSSLRYFCDRVRRKLKRIL